MNLGVFNRYPLLGSPLLAVLLLWAGGCVAVARPDAVAIPRLPENSTYLLHMPGVSGVTLLDIGWLDQLRGVGATDSWEIYEWVGGRSILQALREIDQNRRIARDIAGHLVAFHRVNPHVRIVLVSESAGTAIAVWTLEKLPPDVHVESALLVAPDISPRYDLSAALSHVNHHLFYTTSPLDFGTLGVWSCVLGNMDGVKDCGAGFVGFRAPAGADAAGYQRLIRIPWQLTDILTGNVGNHTGGLSPLFARNVLGPILIQDAESTAP